MLPPRHIHSPSPHADLSRSLLFHNTMPHSEKIPIPTPAPHDPAVPVDFRTFYPYHPNEVKHRKRTSRAQLKVLEDHFRADTKPNATLRKVLAEQLGMSARGVQVWFQNRRAKEKALINKALAARKSSSPKQLPSTAVQSDSENGHHRSGQHRERASHSPAVLDLIPESPVGSHSSLSSNAGTPSTGDTSSESSPIATHPPPLVLGPFGHHSSAIPDPCPTPWQNSPSADDTVFIVHPGDPDPFDPHSVGCRRGSLPVCYPQPADSPLFFPEDRDTTSLGRRRSVDNSLSRLARHPYAHHAREKNSVLYGDAARYPSPSPTPSSSSIAAHQPGRAFPYGGSRPTQSLSPIDLPLYDYVADTHHPSSSSSSLSHHHPPHIVTTTSAESYVPTRVVSAPLPGPLPSPNYSFGAAAVGASPSPQIPSPVDSDPADSIAYFFQNPNHLHGHRARHGDDADMENDGNSRSYVSPFSRFGSMVSLAGSDSSNASAYYPDVRNRALSAGIRPSSSPNGGEFLHLMSGLDVNTSTASLSEPRSDVSSGNSSPGNSAGDSDGHPGSQYSSPSPTISPCTLGNEPPPTTMPSSSALAYALQHRSHHHPHLHHTSSPLNINANTGTSTHAQHHTVPFYYVPANDTGAIYAAGQSTTENAGPSPGVDSGSGMMDFIPSKFGFNGDIPALSANGHYTHQLPGMVSNMEVYAAYGAAPVPSSAVNASFLA